MIGQSLIQCWNKIRLHGTKNPHIKQLCNLWVVCSSGSNKITKSADANSGFLEILKRSGDIRFFYELSRVVFLRFYGKSAVMEDEETEEEEEEAEEEEEVVIVVVVLKEKEEWRRGLPVLAGNPT
ncbi:hypothetical protein M0804_010562 [Polistes exclamans]|nr:hypothetical protein M0804_010562 [Polistes exclamans]